MSDSEEDVAIGPREELYIPEAKLDPNVKRMAWLLFLEAWKVYVTFPAGENELQVETVYAECLETAKVVWHEQEKGYDQD